MRGRAGVGEPGGKGIKSVKRIKSFTTPPGERLACFVRFPNTHPVTTNPDLALGDDAVNRRPLIAAGLLLGVGMGGFVDGILFHQLLQWHNMLSARYPSTGVGPPPGADLAAFRRDIEVNMFWDGLFHAFTWLVTLLGIGQLFSAGRRGDVPWSGRTLVGAMLLGWGLFNVVEGVIDHHLLHVHHVREDLGVSAWDYGFLASGVLLMAAGWLLVRAGRRHAAPRGERPPHGRTA